ncbi:MAG: hypothetical protein M1823_000741, partial [Watsoniomyces obsoletus]
MATTMNVLEVSRGVVKCAVNQKMKPFLTHPEHHTMLALPGCDVLLRPGRTLPTNQYDHRFIESLLIQSRGEKNGTS